MADYQYFYGFKLTDKETGITKRLSDFGGTVYNPNSDGINKNLLPEPNHIVDKNENQDGERYVKTTYGTRIIEIPVVFAEKDGGGNLFELNQWLGKKRQQVFEWENDDENKEIDVIYQKGFDMDIMFGGQFYGLITLTFIAHNPYWRLKNEVPSIYKDLKPNDEIKIKNKGNTDCFPLLEITPIDKSVKIQWNDLIISLSDLDKPFYIDCEKERCYEIIENKQTLNLVKYKSDDYLTFPYLKCDITNKIKILEGNISQIKMFHNTRII